MINCHKVSNLKLTQIYYLIISTKQESDRQWLLRDLWAGSPVTGIKARGGAVTSPGWHLHRRGPPTGPIWLWVEFMVWPVFDRGAHFLAGCGPGLVWSPPSGARWVAPISQHGSFLCKVRRRISLLLRLSPVGSLREVRPTRGKLPFDELRVGGLVLTSVFFYAHDLKPNNGSVMTSYSRVQPSF